MAAPIVVRVLQGKASNLTRIRQLQDKHGLR